MSVPVFKKIGLLAATDSEISLVRETAGLVRAAQTGTFPVFFLGEFLGREIVLAKSGIGKVNSALACLELIKKYPPDCINKHRRGGGPWRKICLSGNPVAGSLSGLSRDVVVGIPNSYGQVQGAAGPVRVRPAQAAGSGPFLAGIRCGPYLQRGHVYHRKKRDRRGAREGSRKPLARWIWSRVSIRADLFPCIKCLFSR